MRRTTGQSLSADLFGTGKDGFRDPGPAGVRGTRLEAASANAFQEELAGAVEGLGFTLSETDNYQLRAALRQMNAQSALGNWQETDANAVSSGKEIRAVASGPVEEGSLATLAVGDDAILIESVRGGVDFVSVITPDASYAGDFNAVLHQGTTFVAVGSAGEIQTIVDAGVAAATRRVSGLAFAWRGIAYGNGVYVVVGESGNIRTATDPTSTWTARTAGSSYAGDFTDVTYSAALGLFVAVGSGREIQTSPDGITWTRRNNGTHDLGRVAVTPEGVLVATFLDGDDAYGWMRSVDAITWTNEVLTGIRLEDAVAFAGCVVAVDVDHPYDVYTTGDGLTWRKRPAAVLGILNLDTAADAGLPFFSTDGYRCYATDRTGATLWASNVAANL